MTVVGLGAGRVGAAALAWAAFDVSFMPRVTQTGSLTSCSPRKRVARLAEDATKVRRAGSNSITPTNAAALAATPRAAPKVKPGPDPRRRLERRAVVVVDVIIWIGGALSGDKNGE